MRDRLEDLTGLAAASSAKLPFDQLYQLRCEQEKVRALGRGGMCLIFDAYRSCRPSWRSWRPSVRALRICAWRSWSM